MHYADRSAEPLWDWYLEAAVLGVHRYYKNEEIIKKCASKIVRAQEHRVLACWSEHVKLMKRCRALCRKVRNHGLHLRMERWCSYCAYQKEFRQHQIARSLSKMMKARQQATFTAWTSFTVRSIKIRRLLNEVHGHQTRDIFKAWRAYHMARKNMTPAQLADQAAFSLQCAWRLFSLATARRRKQAAKTMQRSYRGHQGRGCSTQTMRAEIQSDTDENWQQQAENERQKVEDKKQQLEQERQRKLQELKDLYKTRKGMVRDEERRLQKEERVILEAGEVAVKQTESELGSWMALGGCFATPKAKSRLRDIMEELAHSNLSKAEQHSQAKRKLMDDVSA